VRYQMVMKILDEEGYERGEVVGAVTQSPHSAAKNVLESFREMRNEADRQKKPVELSDELKGAARRFGA
jgi:hypothetical protein